MPHRRKPIKQRPKVEDESTNARRRDIGEPGGGAGRRDEDVGGSGVYPMSAGEHPRGAELRTQGEWAQQLGGQVGGSSELNAYDLGLTDRELDELSRAEEEGDEEDR